MNHRLSRVLSLVLALLLALASTALAEPVTPVYPRSLKMSKASATITIKPNAANTLQLSVSTNPALSSLTEKVSWTSDDESIATVNENGLVQAVGAGKVRIRASIQGANKVLSVACKVTVKEVKATSLKLAPSDQVVLDPSSSSDRTTTIKATVKPTNASFQQVSWSSSDPSVATVDENGQITAVSNGSCTITATADKGRKSAQISVICRDKSDMVPIVLSLGGDIVLGGDKAKKTDKRFEQMISQSGSPDYGYVFKNLKKVFSKDDLTILNLEGPLKGGGTPRKPDREFNFYGKPEYVNILTEGSVEVVNIVNNHIYDYNTKSPTRNILSSAGITISDDSMKNTSYTTVKGAKIGFIGFQTPTSASTIRSKVKKAKATCDILVVSFHFCDVKEHTYAVRSSQITQARAAVQAGADLVLGHHPHVPSGIEVYDGTYIYYSLGSVGSSGPKFKYLNFIAQQTLLWDPATGYVEAQVPTIYPISPSGTYGKDDENNCQPILHSPSDARYAELFDIIDTQSNRGSLNPAPYIKGVP